MPPRGAADGRDPLANPPSIVEVTIEPGPRGRAAGMFAGHRRAVVAGALLIGAVGLVLALGGLDLGGLEPGGHGAGQDTRSAIAYFALPRPAPLARGIEQVVTAAQPYRFPLGCMGTTMTREALASALRSRTGPCWRYGVFVTAILRQVSGVWQLALEARSRSCPRVSLPARVRAQVVVCQR